MTEGIEITPIGIIYKSNNEKKTKKTIFSFKIINYINSTVIFF
jgi:hypothetical protein